MHGIDRVQTGVDQVGEQLAYPATAVQLDFQMPSFDYALGKMDMVPLYPCYAVSDSTADTIVDIAATLCVSRLILGAPQRGTLVKLMRGDIIRQISEALPEDIQLLITA